MIYVGEYQDLIITREMPQGYYLSDKEDEEEVLLPRKYITDDMKMGDVIRVLVYVDSEDRDVATTEQAFFTVDQFAYLKVTTVNDTGAFFDWGTNKELLVPYSNQAFPMREGEHHVVHMYLDEVSDRLVGSTKISKILENLADEHIKMGQQVDILVYKETDIGFKAVVDQNYNGLIYKNEVRQDLRVGDQLKAYVKPIRSDGKIDLSLYPIGRIHKDASEQKIMDLLNKAENGFLPFNDKTDPASILKVFGMSKKLFKKSIGGLYKSKFIIISPEGIKKTS